MPRQKYELEFVDPKTGEASIAEIESDSPPTPDQLRKLRQQMFGGGAPAAPAQATAPSTNPLETGLQPALDFGGGILSNLGKTGKGLLGLLGAAVTPRDPGQLTGHPTSILGGGPPIIDPIAAALTYRDIFKGAQQQSEEQFTKMLQVPGEGLAANVERFGRGLAGTVPLIGPPAAEAAEIAGTPGRGAEGLGEGAGMILTSLLGPKAVKAGVKGTAKAASAVSRRLGAATTTLTRESINTMLGSTPVSFRGGRDPVAGILREGFSGEQVKSTGELFGAVKGRLDELGEQKFQLLKKGDDIRLNRVLDSLDDSAAKLQNVGDAQAAKALRALRQRIFRRGKPVEGSSPGSMKRSSIDAEGIKELLSRKGLTREGKLKSDIGGDLAKARRILDEELENAAPGVRKLNSRIRDLSAARKLLETKTQAELARGLPSGLGDVKNRLLESLSRRIIGRTVRPEDFAEVTNPKTGRPVFVRR